MADVTRVGTPSLASVLPPQNDSIVGLLAGEALTAGDLVYIKASDGRLWKATGAAANAAALVVGMVFVAAAAGEAVTAYHNVNVRYGSGLTPAARYYLSGATAGALADATSTGGTVPLAIALDTTRIKLLPINR